ncbi:MAG: glycosyl hydrolase family 18 [Muribaculaceae bacterium]|nr:glycosyl hydrolase family 18 [Muribaculaceae bacterium]
MIIKTLSKVFIPIGVILACLSCVKTDAEKVVDKPQSKVVAAYVTARGAVLPDPTLVTHINYAFGHVNENFDGVKIANETRLHEVAALKEQNPDLKVLLSIGGWGSGRFSEMVSNDTLRQSFANDCARIVADFNIDGIDIDWEYPGSSAAGISSSEDDCDNFTLLMRDIRNCIGADKLLTIASAASAKFIDFPSVLPYIDFVNIMSYDLGHAPLHQAALYQSENTPEFTCDWAVKAHVAAGIPVGRLVLGMPFYGRGPVGTPGAKYKDIQVPENCTVVFDSIAMVPFIADSKGKMIFGFDNPASLAAKCKYIEENGLLGAMYWEYNGDNDEKELATTVFNGVNSQAIVPHVMALNESEDNDDFVTAAMEWLRNHAKTNNYILTEVYSSENISDEFLKDYCLVVQLNPVACQCRDNGNSVFTDYINNANGALIGFTTCKKCKAKELGAKSEQSPDNRTTAPSDSCNIKIHIDRNANPFGCDDFIQELSNAIERRLLK